ncbi:MAG: DUF1569 domain-containing protein [Bacteroidota bacterium]|nr:DUF1569 domain-containing protein [Bacteroidota bacterium]
MKNLFNQEHVNEVLGRIESLTPEKKQNWGKMSVDQMLAHLNVTYEMMYENNHPKPNPVMKLILVLLVKNAVVSEKPYKQNGATAPAFLIKGNKDFEAEKQRLLGYVNKTLNLGENHFDGLKSHSFGKLNKTEWNNMLYKHLNHHLSQFGV